MSTLTVRAYNVFFGDAILVSIPDRDPHSGIEILRHILIDVGNVLGTQGGSDDVFEPIVQDIRHRLDGRPVDLYVMTHEHLDHVQGLPYAAGKGLELDVDYAWLTASSEPDYYSRFPEARRKRLMLEQSYFAIERHLMAKPNSKTAWLAALMLNNHPYQTKSCVDYLRKLAKKQTQYVHRETNPVSGVHHPFNEAKLAILAPEQDCASYYGQIRPLTLPDSSEDAGGQRPPTDPVPPEGVDPLAFHRLLESWNAGISSSVLAIDRAANNTSVVFLLEWRGWRLLFTGDAEQKSWQMMSDEKMLNPVHFLKVGHHGSHNATPPDPILEKILPLEKADDRNRSAIVSTCLGTYGGVPHSPTLERIGERCDQVLETDSVAAGDSVSISFTG
jgi:beta-lactamase superfamily II metal-dependent hydrolase